MTTRSLRFEVVFPGLRHADRLKLYKDLWSAGDDLTQACNRVASVLFQLKMGTLAWPQTPDGKNVHLRSLAYAMLRQRDPWEPFGVPIYTPRQRRLGGQAMSETASVVFTRIQTDWLDILRGNRALSTFRRMPIGIANQSVELCEDGTIKLRIWAREKGRKTEVRVRPRKIDSGQKAVLERCIKGEYKHGSARLIWHKPTGRKGRWMLSLSWTDKQTQRLGGVRVPAVDAPDRPLVAGVHLGMLTAASVAYIDLRGHVQRAKDLHDLPGSVMRAASRLRKERNERLRTNRKNVGLRAGRGRQRKLRVAGVISDRVSRLHKTAVEQVAAQVVQAALRRGAVAIALQDLHHWSRDRALQESEHLSKRRKAAHRKWYFTWLQGALRAQIDQVAEREGLVVLTVDPRWDSHTCHVCEKNYQGQLETKDGQTYGRVEWSLFRCTCGETVHADRNGAINDAKRALVAYNDHLQKQQAAK